MNAHIAIFANNRITIANALERGALGAGYYEASILLLSALSGIAAIMWPGKQKDRKRFIELLVAHAPSTLHVTNISTALLVQNFLNSGDSRLISAAHLIKVKYLPPHHSQIITGEESDGPEDEILSDCPSLTKKDIREFSYANLLDSEVRCGLMHEFSLGKYATSHPMTERDAMISYTNVLGANGQAKEYKQIHFHYDWLRKLAEATASTVAALNIQLPLSDQNPWWIDE
jgi:hypothetical protein